MVATEGSRSESPVAARFEGRVSLDGRDPRLPREPGPAGRRLLESPVAAAVVSLAAAVFVELPYFRVPHWFDDQIHLEAVARLVQGETGLLDYLLAPHNEHVLPLFRAWFLAGWSLFGLEPAPWHASIALFQAASGFALFVVLRRAARSPVVPLLGAAAWAGAAIGGWEGPLCWIGSSLQVPAGAAFLGAMACLTQAGSVRSRAWGAGMSAFLAVAMLWMGAMVVALPVVLAQAALFEREAFRTPSRRRYWLAAGLLPALLVGIPTLVASSRARTGVPVVDPVSLVETSRRFALVTVNSVAGIAGGPVEAGYIASVVHPAAGVLLVAGLAAFLLRRRIDLRAPLLFAGLATAMTVAALVARRNWPAEMLLSWGRYRYLPTLALVVFAVALVGGLLPGGRRGRRAAATAGLVVLLGAYLAAQRSLADRTAGRLLAFLEPFLAERESWREAIRELSRAGSRQGEPLRFPDGTFELGAVRHSLAHFRTFAVGEATGVSFVPPATLTERDRERSLEALGAIRSPAGDRLRRILRDAGGAPDSPAGATPRGQE